MDDRLQPQQRLVVGEDLFTQSVARDRAAPDHAGEGRLDRRNGLAAGAEQAVDDGVGIPDPHPQPAEQFGGNGFSHGDRSGQAEDDHRAASACSRCARRAGVTSGSTPNQARKPGRA